MPYTDALEQFQAGVEATKGLTSQAATRKLVLDKLEIDPTAFAQVYRPRLAKGIALRNRGNELVTQRGVRWTARGPFFYEQFQFWLGLLLHTAPAPSGANPYTWPYARTIGAVPNPASAVFERSLIGDEAAVDLEAHYCIADELTLRSAGQDGRVDMIVTGFGRAPQASTFTPALSLPTAEIGPAALSKVYLDGAWANLGTTQLATQVLDWEIKIRSGFFPRFTREGLVDLDFSRHGFNAEDVSVEASLNLALANGVYTAELAAARAQTLRALRIQIDGTGSRRLRLDTLVKHGNGDLPLLGEDSGEKVVNASFVESTDGTNSIAAELVNATNSVLG